MYYEYDPGPKLCNQGSENIPVEKSTAPRFETWNGSRDPSGTNLAWVDFLNMGQFFAIDHAQFGFKVVQNHHI